MRFSLYKSIVCSKSNFNWLHKGFDIKIFPTFQLILFLLSCCISICIIFFLKLKRTYIDYFRRQMGFASVLIKSTKDDAHRQKML